MLGMDTTFGLRPAAMFGLEALWSQTLGDPRVGGRLAETLGRPRRLPVRKTSPVFENFGHTPPVFPI